MRPEHVLSDFHPKLRTLYDYWSSLPRDPVPGRESFDILDVAEIATDLVLGERKSENMLELRMVGTNIVSRARMDPTGLNYFELMAPGIKAAEIYNTSCQYEHPCGCLVERLESFGTERLIRTQLLSLPLASGTNPFGIAVLVEADHRPGDHIPFPFSGTSRNMRGYFLDIGAGVPDMPFRLGD